MKLSLTPWSGEPSTLVYESIQFQVMPYGIAESDWMAKLNELKATVDWEKLSDEEQASYSGQAIAGTICTDFKPFTHPDESGTSTITVTFDGESPEPRFKTMGEQLLAQDPLLRAAVFRHAFDRDNYRDMQERQAVGE